MEILVCVLTAQRTALHFISFASLWLLTQWNAVKTSELNRVPVQLGVARGPEDNAYCSGASIERHTSPLPFQPAVFEELFASASGW